MYNLLEYSSNYSDAAGSFRFYSKDEATNFNANIEDDNAFKSFKYKAKLLRNTEADGANGIEMRLINCKVELKLKLTNDCILSANGNDNDDASSNNIIFNIKDTKIYVPVVTLPAKDNKKLSKFFSKGFERSAYWNEYKTKSENKNSANEYRHFLL